jgi:hypothetical protein
MAPHLQGFAFFLAGISASIVTVYVMLAPILAKGVEAHLRLPPSQRRRQSMILSYVGMTAGALCGTTVLLTFGTLLQPFVFIIGLSLFGISGFALVRMRNKRAHEPLAGQQDAPGGSGSPGADGPHAT